MFQSFVNSKKRWLANWGPLSDQISSGRSIPYSANSSFNTVIILALLQASSELLASLSSNRWWLSIHFHQTSWSQFWVVTRVTQVVVLASMAALAPEVNVSYMWGMLLLVVQCPCWCQASMHIVLPSPCGISPSSTVSESHHIVHSIVIMLLEHPWYYLAIRWWSYPPGHLAVGHPWLQVGNLISSQHRCIYG